MYTYLKHGTCNDVQFSLSDKNHLKRRIIKVYTAVVISTKARHQVMVSALAAFT